MNWPTVVLICVLATLSVITFLGTLAYRCWMKLSEEMGKEHQQFKAKQSEVEKSIQDTSHRLHNTMHL
jgi:hypothetical protein